MWTFLLVGGPLLITTFQNCGQMFEAPVVDLGEKTSSSQIFYSGGCEADVLNLYTQTYYPFLKQACGSCHTNGPGIGQFGHSDFLTSYNAFKSMTRSAIDRNIVNASHKPPFTGPQHQATLNNFTPRWITLEDTYGTCAGGVAGSGVLTLGKASPAIIAAAANPNTFTTLTWNLSAEIQNTELIGTIPLTASIQVRVATINGVRQGYEFRNPSVRVNTGYTGPFRVTTLRIFINGTYVPGITMYNIVDYTIDANTDINVSPNTAYALAVMSPIAATDSFAIEFADIKSGTGGSMGNPGGPTLPNPTLPTSVTLAQLLSNDATLGVFRQSCTSCHSAGNASGGLDITNAAQAKLLANDIYNRMNNAANPMPRAGLLSVDRREIVRIWRDTGAN